jgi:ATP-dependent DNA helicase RecG
MTQTALNEKHWVKRAQELLATSRHPVPYETNQIDWKSTLSDNKERLTEHLIAFANQSLGGFLMFGITNDGAAILGINQQDVEKIINQLTNLGRDAVEPPLALEHAIVTIEEKPVLFVHVCEQRNKPAHKRGKSIEETWIRSGATTRKASRLEIASLMLNSPAPRWEEVRATTLLTGKEVIDLLDTATLATLLERRLPEEQSEVLHWLIEEKIITPDSDGYYITQFGGLAAAKNLDQFEKLSRKRIRVIQYRGTNKVETIDEKTGQKGYAVGFESLIRYIKQILPHSEVIQEALRQKISLYPEIALRELIANALIHQDFNVTGAGPTIEVYDNRISITNPGVLLPSKRLDRLIGTAAESRNELFASKFRQCRICEERGTGFQKIVQAVELFGMPPVVFTELENAFQVTLYAPRNFSDMSQDERIEATYQHAVLQYYSSQTLTNTTLRKRFKASERQRNQITNLITDAVDKQRIKRKDQNSGNKFAEYLPYWA